MSSMASENFKGSRINSPGCSGSDDGMKSSPNRRRGSGTSPISHEHPAIHERSGEWISDRQRAIALPSCEIFGPEHTAAELEGAIDNERIPPADFVPPVKAASA